MTDTLQTTADLEREYFERPFTVTCTGCGHSETATQFVLKTDGWRLWPSEACKDCRGEEKV